MAYIVNSDCVFCQSINVPFINGKCTVCENLSRIQAEKEHFDKLNALSLEERVRLIEKHLYYMSTSSQSEVDL